MTSAVVQSEQAGIIQAQLHPLEQFLAGQLSANTRRAYQTDLLDFFEFIGLSGRDLESIKTVNFRNVVAFRNELAASGYKRSTINRKLSSVKALFKMLLAAGLVDQNPADSALVRGYRVEDAPAGKAIDSEALSNILDAISKEKDVLIRTRDAAVFHLLTYGGLRRSEAAGITWTDLLKQGVFHVLRLRDTKSGVAQEVKLQPIVIHHLNEYRNTLELQAYPLDGAVFISLSRNLSHGHPLTAQSINLIVKKYAVKAGVCRNITAHMFRHTCCTLAIEGGAKPQQVQSHLRHKDLKTTMKYYEEREKLLDNASDYIKVS